MLLLITTQVAEAGLNISAPLMITELCPIDSLIQRIGRCQRFKPEGDKGNQEMQGLVLVVKPQQVEEKQKWHIPYMDEINVREKRGNKVTNARLSLAEVSRNILEERFANGGLLDWKTEKAIVDDTLSDAYSAFLNGLDILEYEDIKDKPLGKAYQRLKKLAPVEEGTPLEEADNEGE